MTDKTYKLVPVEPTVAMLQVGKHSLPYRAIDVYRAMIKVAPEPVCRFPSDDEIREFLVVECQAGLIADIDDELLPLAREIIARFGKKVEVAGDE